MSWIDPTKGPPPDWSPKPDSEFVLKRLVELGVTGESSGWHAVATAAGTVIVSRHELLQLPYDGGVGAVVRVAEGKSVLVFSIHPTCCGISGGDQDRRRVEHMLKLLTLVRQIREGSLGEEFRQFRDLPVILAGDWNLVGSRTPLTLAEEAANVRFRLAPLRHVADEDVWTWRPRRNRPGAYAPNRVDMIAHTGGIIVGGGFVLDSGELTEDELAALGLESGDSATSDHLIVVADFAFPNR